MFRTRQASRIAPGHERRRAGLGRNAESPAQERPPPPPCVRAGETRSRTGLCGDILTVLPLSWRRPPRRPACPEKSIEPKVGPHPGQAVRLGDRHACYDQAGGTPRRSLWTTCSSPSSTYMGFIPFHSTKPRSTSRFTATESWPEASYDHLGLQGNGIHAGYVAGQRRYRHPVHHYACHSAVLEYEVVEFGQVQELDTRVARPPLSAWRTAWGTRCQVEALTDLLVGDAQPRPRLSVRAPGP